MLDKNTDSDWDLTQDTDISPTENDRGEHLLDRRSYLKLGAATAAIFSHTVAGSAQEISTEQYGFEFDRVANAVEDLGMDPTGEEPVEGVITGTNQNTLIQFPDGEYRFEPDPGGISVDGELFGCQGIGSDVTFVVPEGYSDVLIDGGQMEGVYLDDIDVDQTARDASTGLRFRGTRVVIQNMTVSGSGGRRGPLYRETRPGGGTTSGGSHFTGETDRDSSGTETLRIEGSGSPANYELTVAGEIVPETRQTAGYGVSGSTAEGTVNAGSVEYAVAGDITALRIDGPAVTYLDGERVEAGTVESEVVQPSCHRVAFEGTERDTRYAFAAEQICSTEETGANSTGEVADTVTEGVDSFRFQGELDSLSAHGTTALTF